VTQGASSVLPSEWARLHKLSPLLRGARQVVALAFVLGGRQLQPGQGQSPYIDLGVLALVFVGGVISWLVTRWRIHNGELQIETGWIRRQSLRVPLTRLQAVDVVRPLLARMLGLAEVRIVVAGQGSSRTRLAYLTEDRATQVRAQLLALAHGLEGATPEPPEQPILYVPGKRIVAANLLTVWPFLFVALVAAASALIVVSPSAGGAGIGGAFGYAVAAALVTARRIGAEWEYTVAEAPDGVRLRSGLLQHRAETIPFGRAQAIRWVEPLLWRPKGWVRLEIDVARRHDRDRAERETGVNTRALLPVGSADEARWLLSRVMPGAMLQPPARDTVGRDANRAPRRALLRAPLTWHNLRCWYDDTYVVCMTGRLRRTIVVVPLAKVQSLRWTQGPVSRALRLASVHADTAGRRFPGSAVFRDVAESGAWMATLPDLAHAARQRALSR